MDSGDVSVHPPAPALPVTAQPASVAPRENPFGEHAQRRAPAQNLRKRIGSALAAIAALLAKFWAAIKGVVLLLPKAKLLTTAGTAIVSVVAYSLFFGWTFAIGFVILLFVHEMGHVIQLRREGIKASAPMFIPLLGAVVMMKSMPDDALAEARVVGRKIQEFSHDAQALLVRRSRAIEDSSDRSQRGVKADPRHGASCGGKAGAYAEVGGDVS